MNLTKKCPYSVRKLIVTLFSYKNQVRKDYTEHYQNTQSAKCMEQEPEATSFSTETTTVSPSLERYAPVLL